MYTCIGGYDCVFDCESLMSELSLESKIDATWNTPQSSHNSLGDESNFMATAFVDGGAVGGIAADVISVVVVVEADAISIVDEDAISIDEARAISVVDEDSTPELLVGARVEGRKILHLLR